MLAGLLRYASADSREVWRIRSDRRVLGPNGDQDWFRECFGRRAIDGELDDLAPNDHQLPIPTGAMLGVVFGVVGVGIPGGRGGRRAGGDPPAG